MIDDYGQQACKF